MGRIISLNYVLILFVVSSLSFSLAVTASKKDCNSEADLLGLLEEVEKSRPKGIVTLDSVVFQKTLNDAELYSRFEDLPMDIPESLTGKLLVLGDETAYKDVYTMVDGYDGVVLGVSKEVGEDAREQLVEEIDTLIDLKTRGFPTVRFSTRITSYNGKPAYAMERLVASNRDITDYKLGKLVAAEDSEVITLFVQMNKEKSWNSLNNIKNMVEQQNIEIGDMQFLFAKDGSFVINDPGYVRSASDGGNVAVTVYEITQLMEYIESL